MRWQRPALSLISQLINDPVTPWVRCDALNLYPLSFREFFRCNRERPSAEATGFREHRQREIVCVKTYGAVTPILRGRGHAGGG